MKALTILFILIILLVGIYLGSQSQIYDNLKNKITSKINKNKDTANVFQGPVPEGYDEQHFRETGETILIKENGN